MSSEYVEVLRDLSEVCRAAIKAGDWKVDGACDPDSLLRHADAAIAALSAPQSGDWVLVRRSAIESAIETLENDGDEHGEGRNLRAAIDEAAAPQPPAEAQEQEQGGRECCHSWQDYGQMNVVRCNKCEARAVNGYEDRPFTAPPSAPVGVEE